MCIESHRSARKGSWSLTRLVFSAPLAPSAPLCTLRPPRPPVEQLNVVLTAPRLWRCSFWARSVSSDARLPPKNRFPGPWSDGEKPPPPLPPPGGLSALPCLHFMCFALHGSHEILGLPLIFGSETNRCHCTQQSLASRILSKIDCTILYPLATLGRRNPDFFCPIFGSAGGIFDNNFF